MSSEADYESLQFAQHLAETIALETFEPPLLAQSEVEALALPDSSITAEDLCNYQSEGACSAEDQPLVANSGSQHSHVSSDLQSKPLLPEAELDAKDHNLLGSTDTSHKNLWRSWQSYATLLIVLVAITSNTGVIYLSLRTIRMGPNMTFYYPSLQHISDQEIITFINILATLVHSMTCALGAWALSQQWSRSVRSGNGSTLAELQAAGSFGGLGIVWRTTCHLVRGLFSRKSVGYIAILLSAIVLQFYPTAFVTLSVPTLIYVADPLSSYQYNAVSFMSDPGEGNTCDASFTTLGTTWQLWCLDNYLVGTSASDIIHFDALNRPPGGFFANAYWTDLVTPYPPLNLMLYSYLGPLNGNDMSGGAVMFGQNTGTVEGLIGYFGPAKSIVPESVGFNIQTNTTVPILMSQCGSQNVSIGGDTNITVGNTTYTLPEPIPLLNDSFAIGQVTPDNTTLLISLRVENTSQNMHCAIGIGLREAPIFIQNGLSVLTSNPDEQPWYYGNMTTLATQARIDLRSFATRWLAGMGWSTTPTETAISGYLTRSRLQIGTNTPPSPTPFENLRYAEYYVLTLLASGIALAFPQESNQGQSGVAMSETRYYLATRQQYYLGVTSTTSYLLVCVLIISSFLVLYWAKVILWDSEAEWLPDWTDSATMMCYAVNSEPSDILEPGDITNRMYRASIHVQKERLVVDDNKRVAPSHT
ncbi:hypothetical protein BJ138DRAFT_47113 [Hygrophoropsis aurantiaca]|uniref:Uncharacterized protein n=1 Tax=Hygrophoropsis aurantiaca TaxID=72124 RepID=A0ACB7ZSD9_9AGAM|nr:hypothetical protein BJ138DRAFT_47113 [Hygrophoropsis aurantiaca]